MDDQLALMRGILEEPAEDLPRLVYADWLEERGNAHGEWIRLQCHLARATPESEAYPALDQEVRRFFARHQLVWMAPLRSISEYRLAELTPHRGFVPMIPVNALGFLEWQWIHSPLVLEVELNVGFRECVSPSLMEQLHASDRLKRLTRLHCLPSRGRRHYWDQAIGGLTMMLRDVSHPLLFEVDLSHCLLSITGLRLLQESEMFRGVSSLRLRNCNLMDVALERWLDSSQFEHLRSLDLSENQIGDNTARILLESPHLQKLERIAFLGTDLLSRDLALQLSKRFDPLLASGMK
jgi:uncharacterized protein (TIGR02996 family)